MKEIIIPVVKKLEEINKINQEIKDLERIRNDLKRSIDNRTKASYRKERARRLIETGALAEKYFKIENLSINEREELFKIFSSFIQANKPEKFKK
jgi:hypothetical protein